jgi:hypothetical protein
VLAVDFGTHFRPATDQDLVEGTEVAAGAADDLVDRMLVDAVEERDLFRHDGLLSKGMKEQNGRSVAGRAATARNRGDANPGKSPVAGALLFHKSGRLLHE